MAKVKKAHGKTLTKMREGFEANLDELRGRCDSRLSALEDDLELRRKVRPCKLLEGMSARVYGVNGTGRVYITRVVYLPEYIPHQVWYPRMYLVCI